MTIEGKREKLDVYYKGRMCNECKLNEKCSTLKVGNYGNFYTISTDVVEEFYDVVFGAKVEQSQLEEINHPDRYAGDKFECIDVMLDVFGADAVKHFCVLNAFKYVWRAEKKNGVEDIKKAVWYLNKYIEL